MALKHRDLVVVIQCLTVLMAIECMTDCPPTPELSYQWTDEFEVRLNWQSPETSDGSTRKYIINDSSMVYPVHLPIDVTTEELETSWFCSSEMSSNSCELRRPEPSDCSIFPVVKLVRDFSCSLYDHYAINCSWIPESYSSDLQVFYGFLENSSNEKRIYMCKPLKNTETRSCQFMTKNLTDNFWMLINGTLNGSPVNNTFKRKPSKNVKTRPPEMTIEDDGHNLSLRLTPLYIGSNNPSCWTYEVNYSKCNEPEKKLTSISDWLTLPYDKRCQYKFKAKAIFSQQCGAGGSDFSEYKTYGEDESSNWLIGVIIIPIILSVLIILVCCCFRRYKSVIFPAIPDPSVIFKEVMNRNKESTIQHLYVPEEDDTESGKITLVPQDGSS